MGRRFHRHLDVDLIARVLNKVPRREEPTLKRVKPKRKLSTYRGARRNAQRVAEGGIASWRGVEAGGGPSRRGVRANKRFRSYAREIAGAHPNPVHGRTFNPAQ